MPTMSAMKQRPLSNNQWKALLTNYVTSTTSGTFIHGWGTNSTSSTGITYTPTPYTPPVPYRAQAPLEFNKFINSSDLVEEFIKFCGEQKVKKSEVMGLPIEHFIKWLIIKACEQDNEEPNVVLQLPAPKRNPRCNGCQKYMKKSSTLLMHSERCAGFYFKRVSLPVMA